jgi:hypothetical protein
MRFAEVNLLGVYVAPIAPLMLAAWLLATVFRWSAERHDLLRHVWHPALVMIAVYVLFLSALVLLAAGAGA